ncbi:diacylglycerol kinase family lipid kinase [bacterium]|nr:diacylglycerol kinase family lipid kinase [bacterium]
MKLLVLANPAAAGGRALRQLPQVKEWCERLPHSFEFDVPANRDLTVKRSRDAVKGGYDAVVAFGGDGTLADVIEGTLGEKIKIGLIPSGRGNDFARNTGIPLDLEKAVEMLGSETTKRIDVATMNGSPYVNVGGVGFDAEVVNTLNRTPCKFTGTICYILAVLRTLLTFKAIPLSIDVDDKHFEGRYMMVAAGNGLSYGGGMKITPNAVMDDGLLDVVLVDKVSRLTLLRLFPSVYSGEHIHKKPVTMLRGKKITIHSDNVANIAIDGEPRGSVPAEFEVGTYSLNLIVK